MKISKEQLKKLIVEELGGQFIGSSGPLATTSNQGATVRNYGPSGKPPDNSNKPFFQGRPPYETLGVETHIEDGQIYVTVGKIQYQVIFDNENLTSGRVSPIGEFGFNIVNNNVIEWNDSTPIHIKFDTQLEKQIIDLSGRESETT